MTDSTDIWNDPDLSMNNEYVKFDDIGDEITGKILSIRKHTFEDGKVVPQILLDVDGEEKTLTAGQVRLKAELAEKRPGVGDVLTVKLSDIEKRSGGRTLKHFEVTVGETPQAAQPTPAAQPAAAPAQEANSGPVDEQAAMAAINNLTAEQKQALGIS